ncbi:cyclin domain-containing protein [Planoprotostelium fungivorum]|uniref:Cyclin domain-containing protein n=1 Tax=Planoprotostelium fungivorum TaxID=1890364 RepID=A0A2P6N761_9EUKA|nr:cyclin domain-containing protein [Planoprotostelium fungivorum]
MSIVGFDLLWVVRHSRTDIWTQRWGGCCRWLIQQTTRSSFDKHASVMASHATLNKKEHISRSNEPEDHLDSKKTKRHSTKHASSPSKHGHTSSPSKKSSRARNHSPTRQRPTVERSDIDATQFLKSISLGRSIDDLSKEGEDGDKSKNSKNSKQRAVKKRTSAATLRAYCQYESSEARILFLPGNKEYPFAVSSIIRYESNKKEDTDNLREASIGDKFQHLTESSLEHLLSPHWISHKDEGMDGDEHHELKRSQYDPDFIDDPDLTTGKHKTVLNLPFYRGSIIPFVRPDDLKSDLNDQFRRKHPWINAGVKLYKIRKVKKKLYDVIVDTKLDFSFLALAYVLLDRLIMRNVIFRENLKPYAVVCLLLSIKFNDPIDYERKPFSEAVEKYTKLEWTHVLHLEFEVFAKLSFGLFVEPSDVIPHLQRISQTRMMQQVE